MLFAPGHIPGGCSLALIESEETLVAAARFEPAAMHAHSSAGSYVNHFTVKAAVFQTVAEQNG